MRFDAFGLIGGYSGSSEAIACRDASAIICQLKVKVMLNTETSDGASSNELAEAIR